jgi:AcrR family transcriptional regulator
MNVAIEGVRPPLQQRSQRSFERALVAGADLLREEGIEGFSISEVCRRANISVGSLYTRIDSRDALLLAIHDDVITKIGTELAVFDPDDSWTVLTTHELVDRAVRELGGVYERNSSIMRVFILRAASDAEMRKHGAVMSARLADAFTALLITRESDIPHPNPRDAINACFRLAADGIAWETAFGRDFVDIAPVTSGGMLDRLARACTLSLLTPLDQ